MSAETNKAILHRMVNDFNRRDLSFVDAVFSPHFVLHTALTAGWPQGVEGARQMFTTMLSTAHDIHVTIEDIIGEGEKVAVRWTFRGTHRGESRLVGSPTHERFTAATMQSASSTVLTRCATTRVVRSAACCRSAAWMRVSVSTSTDEVLSSRIRMAGCRSSARAMASRCFCPPERLTPRSSTCVS